MCDSLTSSSSFRRTQRGKKTRDDDDGKNEEKHNNNNGIVVFDDDDDDVKVVFEVVPLPRRALSSSMFSFMKKRFRLSKEALPSPPFCTF